MRMRRTRKVKRRMKERRRRRRRMGMRVRSELSRLPKCGKALGGSGWQMVLGLSPVSLAENGSDTACAGRMIQRIRALCVLG